MPRQVPRAAIEREPTVSARAADTTVVLLDDYRHAEWAERDPLDLVAELLPEWTVAFTELDGVMGFCEPERRTIWIDLQTNGAARRCTIVHELLHALRGDMDDDSDAEQIVQVETARRLVPLRALRDLLAGPGTLAGIAAALNVDEDVLDTRLRTLTKRNGCPRSRAAGRALSDGSDSTHDSGV